MTLSTKARILRGWTPRALWRHARGSRTVLRRFSAHNKKNQKEFSRAKSHSVSVVLAAFLALSKSEPPRNRGDASSRWVCRRTIHSKGKVPLTTRRMSGISRWF
jgi:hypothetical protein